MLKSTPFPFFPHAWAETKSNLEAEARKEKRSVFVCARGRQRQLTEIWVRSAMAALKWVFSSSEARASHDSVDATNFGSRGRFHNCCEMTTRTQGWEGWEGGGKAA
eukprot:689339-Rhodomonas_salina.4